MIIFYHLTHQKYLDWDLIVYQLELNAISMYFETTV